MQGAKWYSFEDCKIVSVKSGDKSKLQECVITLEAKDNSHRIEIADSDYAKQVRLFLEGVRNRCCFTYGMHDIDIFKNLENRYVIHHSPFAGVHFLFSLLDGEVNKLAEVS